MFPHTYCGRAGGRYSFAELEFCEKIRPLRRKMGALSLDLCIYTFRLIYVRNFETHRSNSLSSLNILFSTWMGLGLATMFVNNLHLHFIHTTTMYRDFRESRFNLTKLLRRHLSVDCSSQIITKVILVKRTWDWDNPRHSCLLLQPKHLYYCIEYVLRLKYSLNCIRHLPFHIFQPGPTHS